MTLEEIGAFLRTEREKRNLSVDEVADQLKINSRTLSALEAGDMARLPPPAYVRGFIRTYADYLGIGAEEKRSLLDSLSLDNQQKKEIPQKKIVAQSKKSDEKPSAAPAKKKEKKSHKSLYIWAILAALAICGWWAWQDGRLDFLKDMGEKQPLSVETLPSADTYKAPEPERKEEPEPLQPQVEPSLALPLEPEKIAEKPQEENNAEKAQVEQAVPEQEKPTQHKLVITATEECWVHSNADKSDTRQFSLRKGDTFALTFAKNLQLKLGNAGGVRLRYDGNDLPPPGTSGQVKTLVFPPDEN